MKSLVRLAALLGIAGSTLLAPSLFGGKMPAALALPEQQVLDKLGPVPVFTIADAQGGLLTTRVPAQQNNASGPQVSLGLVFISYQDAQSFLEQRVKPQNPQMAQGMKVTPISLSEIYKLYQANKNKPERLVFEFVPTKQQVDYAVALLRQEGKQVNEFNEVPLFVAVQTDGQNKSYLPAQIDGRNEQVIPFYFNKDELQNEVNRLKQERPEIGSKVSIEVSSLERLLEALASENEPMLTKIQLVAPSESREYLLKELERNPSGGTRQPTRPQNTQPTPQPSGSQTPTPNR